MSGRFQRCIAGRPGSRSLGQIPSGLRRRGRRSHVLRTPRKYFSCARRHSDSPWSDLGHRRSAADLAVTTASSVPIHGGSDSAPDLAAAIRDKVAADCLATDPRRCGWVPAPARPATAASANAELRMGRARRGDNPIAPRVLGPLERREDAGRDHGRCPRLPRPRHLRRAPRRCPTRQCSGRLLRRLPGG
jgi:hypothetical protein